MAWTALALCFIIAGTLYLLADKLLTPRLDPREPPLLKSDSSIFTHLSKILQQGFPYFAEIGKTQNTPLFTIALPLQKLYIATNPTLLKPIQRVSKLISSDPILTAAASHLAGVRGPGLTLLRECENGGHGLGKATAHAMYPALLGDGLAAMNRTMLSDLGAAVDELAGLGSEGARGGGGARGCPIDLYAWCRHAVTVASTASVWGPANPYRDAATEQAFWDFEANISLLALNVIPRLTARKAFLARERLAEAFMVYFREGGHLAASALTLARYNTQRDGGCALPDIARLEVAAGLGYLSNTVPAIFWMLFEVFSRPVVLAALREEVEGKALGRDEVTGAHVLDLLKIREECPLLTSTWQEVLRRRSSATMLRVVAEDVVIDNPTSNTDSAHKGRQQDQYLLKKGAILQVPSQLIDHDPTHWGDAASTFDHTRFIGLKQHANNFLPFGMAPAVCPGRHFATGEVLAAVAMIILRIDVVPAPAPAAGKDDGDGGKVDAPWIEPAKNTRAAAASLLPPRDPFMVTVEPRAQYQGVKTWGFAMGESGGSRGRFNLVIG